MSAIVIGAGGYGEVIAFYLRSEGIELYGFVDDSPLSLGRVIGGIPVLGDRRVLSSLRSKGVSTVYVAIGDSATRLSMIREARISGYDTPNIILGGSTLSSTPKPGTGCFILPGANVMPFVSFGDGVIISMGTNVAHHVSLEDGVFLSTGVSIGARVTVERNAFVGIGATVMTGVHQVGTGAVVGAGAVVIRDVASMDTVAGVPARSVRHR